MFSYFNEESQKILINAKKEMQILKHSYIGTEHLLLSILSTKNNVSQKLNKNGINYKNYKEKLIETVGIGKETTSLNIYTPTLKRIIEESIISSRENNEESISVDNIISELFEEGEGLGLRILFCLGLSLEGINTDFIVKRNRKKNSKKRKLYIEEYGYSINEKVKKGEIDPVIGRNLEINRIIEILCRRIKNNPLLIGEAGVGKTAIVEEIARKIEEGTVPEKLKNKKIISVSISNLVSGTKYRGEFEERINKILNELEESNNIIIFIDEIHTLIGAGGAEGAIDASNILKPYLARGKIKVIGATTIDEYKKYIENDKALGRRFQKIKINEPNEKDTYNILKGIKSIYEDYHKVNIEDNILKQIIFLSNKYITEGKQPDKSIDILDEACSKISISKSNQIKKLENYKKNLNIIRKQKNFEVKNHKYNNAIKLKEEESKIESKINTIEQGIKRKKSIKNVMISTIEEIVESKIDMPITKIKTNDKSMLQIEKKLKTKIIGQDNIINILMETIKNNKEIDSYNEKPLSFLFAGPSGVGKTSLAKQLGKYLTNNKIIKINMNEFKESHSISKIIGSPPGYVGYENKNTILDQIKMNPNCIILLDEIEKAHTDVVNLFLEALDEGIIKTASNEEIMLNNYIIIMTTNIGNNKNIVGYSNNNKDNIFELINNYFGNEIIGRIDQVLLFEKLTKETISKIIKNKYKTYIKKYNRCKKNLAKNLPKSSIEDIIIQSEYKNYGARKIDNILKKQINKYIFNENIEKKVNITMETY